MLEIYERYGGSTVAVERVPAEEVSRYGIIKPKKIAERIYQVLDMVEKPSLAEAPSRLAILGRYVLALEIFQSLEAQPPGKNGEIQLTDALCNLIGKQAVYAYEFEGERYDAGTPLGWLKTTVALALIDPKLGPELKSYLRRLLRAGTRSR